MEQLADLDATADQVLTCRGDIGDSQFQALEGARLRRRDPLPEMNRTTGARRRELDAPEVLADVEVRVFPPSEA